MGGRDEILQPSGQHQPAELEGERERVAPGRRSLTASIGARPGAGAMPSPGKIALTHRLAPEDVATEAVESKGAGHSLDSAVRSQVEPVLGTGLDGVRVHEDGASRAASAAIGARAFTYGRDVFLGQGESASDVSLMAHELTHVVQQGAVARPKVQRKVDVGPADSPAERQADAVAGQVTSNSPPAQMVVEIGAPLAAGQMTRQEFLARLRESVTQAAGEALGPFWLVAGCPYIDRWFARHQNASAHSLDQLARRYSGIQSPRTAAEMIPPICARVKAAVRQWRNGGDVSGELAAVGLGSVDATAAAGPTAAATAGATGADAGPAAQRKPIDEALSSPLAAELGGPGQPLAGGVRDRFGDAFGQDFSQVRIHTDPHAARKAQSEGAIALAVGNDIAFAPGAYNPGTPAGDALLAHELAHTVQQQHAGASGGVAQRKRVGEESEAHEEDADQATVGAMARLYGATTARARVALQSDFQLQRCDNDTPAITDAFVLGLKAKLDAGDKAGFFSDLRGLGGSRAGDGAVRAGLQQFLADGKIGSNDGFRAVALQELGAERSWPEVVKNFAEGADAGTFTVRGLPPAGADPLREYCVLAAGEAADGTADVRANYRNRFNAKWDVAPYAGLPADFDATLDSKGPKNQRARRIFNDLYADTAIKTAYDKNSPAGFREMCDTFVGPDGVNLIASPRLQALRAALGPPTVAATGTADAAYTALVAAVRPKAEALDARDRQEMDRSHQWRLAVDGKVVGPNDGVTGQLRGDLWSVVTTSRSAGPAAPVVAPVAEPAPSLNAAQRDFLKGITIAPAAATVDADSDAKDIVFNVRSARPNPSLAARRKVVIEPGNQVVTGSDDETDWPSGSSAVPHTAKVNPDAGGPASTVFTAKLTMPPVPAADFAEKTATVTVRDKRLDWFKANVDAGVSAVNQNDYWGMAAGGSVPFKGGQVPILIRPGLPAPNPGLTVFMDGNLKRGGVVAHSFPRTALPAGRTGQSLFDTILTQKSPPVVGPENFEVTVHFYGASGPAFHTVTLPFQIAPNMAAPVGGDAALMAADNAALNTPIGSPGLLDHMDKSGKPAWQRVARGVASGALKVQACFIRSDAATFLAAKGHDPTKLTAYAMGAVSDARTLVAAPGAAGWRWGGAADTVFLNRTPLQGSQRSLDDLAEFLAHEGIHAADRSEPDTWGRYTTEFRAYWVMGLGDTLSTAPDPTMSGIGPKSPRARAIFDHLYGSSTYPFVQSAYDANTSGFRTRVDNYLYPDGINLSLSANLTALRSEIESYAGSSYAAKKAAVTSKYAACTPDDKREITNNRMWRDLVEEKFTGEVRVSWIPPRKEREADQIKAILGIPR